MVNGDEATAETRSRARLPLRGRGCSLLPLAVIAALAAGCWSSLPEPTPLPIVLPPADAAEHVLFTPTGDAEALLGRSVSRGPQGSWVISDELAPGCHVTARETKSAWRRHDHEDLKDLALASASLGSLIELRARYGQHIRLEVDVRNSGELVADLDGPCGEVVIKSVKIGTGSRELQYSKEIEGSTGGGVAGVGIHGRGGRWKNIGRRLEWNEAQAWAFTTRKLESSENLDISVHMPAELKHEDYYTIRVVTTRQAWLVVLYVQQGDGKAGILFPDRNHGDAVARAGGELELPRAQAYLLDPAVGSHDKLLVYAFSEKRDYDDFKPPPGAPSEREIADYIKALPERLRKLPRRRWDSAEMNYVIHPLSTPAASR